jgi:hypothetical protein
MSSVFPENVCGAALELGTATKLKISTIDNPIPPKKRLIFCPIYN